jgi:two-component system, OmpR family, sensor histidine kinase VicK
MGSESTEVIHGGENTLKVSLECFARVKQRYDSFGDFTLPSVIMSVEPLKNAYIELGKKGIRTRFITEITKENISYCKELMKIVHELRHLDSLKGNFGVSEIDYVSIASQQKAEPISQIIHSNIKAVIEQQQYLFESLWNKAISAEQRVREIEEGVKPEVSEVINGPENTIRVSLECFARVKGRHDSCGDDTLPSVIVTTEPIKDAYRELLRRGIKTRFITEITEKNIAYCKELMKIVYELRHLEDIKGNFGISESDYIATAIQQESRPIPQLIHSNAKAMIEQQQYFFETLWDKAIPAEQKIREIEEGIELEKTEVVYGVENVIKKNIECFLRAKEMLDVCHDSTGPSVTVNTQPIMKAAADFTKRGGRIRFVTEITKENIDYCKQLMELCEARHIDGIKGNFGVGEKDYLAMGTTQEGKPLPQVIHSNVKTVIEQQKYIFETLWNKAIPARQKIREIEEGIKPEVIETIQDPNEIQQRGFTLLKLAKEEIMIIFSTANAFRRQSRVGLVSLLREIMRDKHDIRIRIMTPVDQGVKGLAEELRSNSPLKGVDVRYIEEPLQTKVSVLIVDRLFSLAVELKDDSKENSSEAIGLATYSNSKATVLSYSSIFESLWNQTDLYEQISSLYEKLKVHDKLQNQFINVAAHELRTPIQPILGLAEVLRDQPMNSHQSRLLDAIIRNAKRLQRLQEDILDVSRIESNMLKLEVEQFNLEKVIVQVIEDFKSQTDGGKIRIVYRRNKGEDFIVNGDKSRLIQVISNLMSNAIKFTRLGTVYLKSKREVSQIRVSITDTGSGIDPEIFPHLFTKFATKSEKGTGLGLFISKSIVDAHNGRIWAENNKDGKGATFVFTLPLTP